jgi:hypothetical protein
MKTPENAKEDADDPESAYEGDTQMEYSSDYLYSPSTGAVRKLPIGTKYR